jgi:hypothetical protein
VDAVAQSAEIRDFESSTFGCGLGLGFMLSDGQLRLLRTGDVAEWQQTSEDWKQAGNVHEWVGKSLLPFLGSLFHEGDVFGNRGFWFIALVGGHFGVVAGLRLGGAALVVGLLHPAVELGTKI